MLRLHVQQFVALNRKNSMNCKIITLMNVQRIFFCFLQEHKNYCEVVTGSRKLLHMYCPDEIQVYFDCTLAASPLAITFLGCILFVWSVLLLHPLILE